MPNKVLIVDDSEPLHQNIKITLKRYKCEIFSALSREDGVIKLTENPGVSLIFIDMNMSLSRISGIDFIKKVKEQEAYANIPIVILPMRGRSYSEDAQALADVVLAKPFTSNELHSVVEKLFPQAVVA